MKYFILSLLFICTANANYIKKSKVGSCGPTKIYSRKAFCGDNCVRITKDYNCNYSKLETVMVEDLEKPTHSKTEVEACVDQVECEAKNAVKTCAEEGAEVLMSEAYDEIYCYKLSYEQKDSGKKKIVDDATKKADYMAQVQADEDAKKSEMDKIKSIKSKLGKDDPALTDEQIKKIFKFLLKAVK